MPSLAVHGPQDIWKLSVAFHLGNALAAAAGLAGAVIAWAGWTAGRGAAAPTAAAPA